MDPKRNEQHISSNDELIPVLRRHLDQEESVLTATLETLREVRKTLLDNDLDALTQSLEQQAKWAARSEELQTKRTQLLQDFAASLDIDSGDLTLERLAQALPSENSNWIAECRNRLHTMAEESQQLNYQNALLIRQSFDLTRNVLSQLTAEGDRGDTYNAAGTKQGTVGDSLIELGG